MPFMLLTFETEDEKDKFTYVYTRWKGLLLSKAYGVLHDHAMAQDAVNEAFIRVYKNLRKLDDVDSGRTAAFLVMIVKNVALTMLRKRGAVADTAIDADRADPFDLEGTVVAESRLRELLAIIGRLPDDLKTPFLLKYAYDYSLKEISALLKISENNAAVRLHRAKAKLMKILKQEEGANSHEGK